MERTATSLTLIKLGIPLTNGKAAMSIPIGNLIGQSLEITTPVKDSTKTLQIRMEQE